MYINICIIFYIYKYMYICNVHKYRNFICIYKHIYVYKNIQLKYYISIIIQRSFTLMTIVWTIRWRVWRGGTKSGSVRQFIQTFIRKHERKTCVLIWRRRCGPPGGYAAWGITQCSRVLPYKLTVHRLFKKSSPFYGIRRFILPLTSARHPSLSRARLIQPTPPHV